MVTSEAARAHKKEYNKEHYQANKGRLLARRKAYIQANKERVAAYAKAYNIAKKEQRSAYHREHYTNIREKKCADARAYYQANKEKKAAYTQAYAQANPGKINAISAKRKAAKIQRTPNWLTVDDYHAIRTLYETAAALTKSTGINHHVDHIIPLQGRTVSGFHCPTNLQILTATENQIKNNKFTGDE